MTSSASTPPLTQSRPARFAPGAPGRLRARVRANAGWTLGLGALVVYLFVVHSYKVNLGSAAIVVGLFATLIGERPLRFSASMGWYAAYLLWALMTMPVSIMPSVSWTSWVDALKLLVIMFLALNAIRGPRQYRFITLAWLGMFAFYPVRGTLFNFLTGNGEFGRYGWNFIFKNFNDMAALTLLPLALSIDRLRTPDRKWVKMCALAGVIMLPFIVLITGSRGGLLGLAAMLLFLFARSRYRLRMVVMGVGVAGVALIFAPANVWERIQRMTYLTSVETLQQSDDSAQQRYLIWQVARTIIADSPVSGVGIGTYSYAHVRYAEQRQEWAFARGYRDAHSTYLRVMAETGAVGLGLFLMVFLSAFSELRKAARELKKSEVPLDMQYRDRFQAYQAALVGFAVCVIFGSLNTVVFPFLFITLGAVTVRFRTPQRTTIRQPSAARALHFRRPSHA